MDDTHLEEPPASPTAEELAAQLNGLKTELAKAKRSVVWEAVVCSSIIATLLALLVGAGSAFWRDQGPTTADDDLDSLLKPGPHCYNSAAEMAAARQRALTAVDRIRWEREFTRRWESEHPQPVLEPISMIPPNVSIEPPPPPVPMIVGPKDPGVSPSSDPRLSVSDDRCFGIREPVR